MARYFDTDFWIDLNGAIRRPIFAAEKRCKYDGKTRRFCSRCGKLRECFIHNDVVRCAECSGKAGVPALRCAGLSALTRQKENVRYQRHTQRVVETAAKKPPVSIPALVEKYRKPLQPRSYSCR